MTIDHIADRDRWTIRGKSVPQAFDIAFEADSSTVTGDSHPSGHITGCTGPAGVWLFVDESPVLGAVVFGLLVDESPVLGAVVFGLLVDEPPALGAVAFGPLMDEPPVSGFVVLGLVAQEPQLGDGFPVGAG
ncbi:hypothetical protein ACIGXI_04980 [Kitasatospora aureofaciens]|uniref:hypothetical protein n=1 Tax=Kitasatospora aureofaciens TaxID=1894 RepID=UPI0037CA0B47